MRVAYFSPFNPLKSGISDFSEELVKELKEYLNIDLFTDQYEPSNKEIVKNFKIYNMERIKDDKFRKQYDFLIFHVGNCKPYHKKIVDIFLKYGGVLELHDVSLFHFWVESTVEEGNKKAFIDLMEYCHGDTGRKVATGILDGTIKERWGNLPQKFTLNKTLVEKAQAIIVHSDIAKQMIKAIRPDVKIINIMHHSAELKDKYKKYKTECRKKLNIDKNEVMIASFGFANVSKRICSILEVVKKYNKNNNKKLKYYIVGEIKEQSITDKIEELGLGKQVVVTGYKDLEEFKSYMGATDVVLNLRYPTQMESSGSLHRALGMGKPVIVTDVGSFSEYPEDTVIKVRYDIHEIDDIYNAISKLISDKALMDNYESNAFKFAEKKCNIKNNAKSYANFILKLLNNDVREDDIADKLVDTLSEFCLMEDKYADMIAKKIDLGIEW